MRGTAYPVVMGTDNHQCVGSLNWVQAGSLHADSGTFDAVSPSSVLAEGFTPQRCAQLCAHPA